MPKVTLTTKYYYWQYNASKFYWNYCKRVDFRYCELEEWNLKIQTQNIKCKVNRTRRSQSRISYILILNCLGLFHVYNRHSHQCIYVMQCSSKHHGEFDVQQWLHHPVHSGNATETQVIGLVLTNKIAHVIIKTCNTMQKSHSQSQPAERESVVDCGGSENANRTAHRLPPSWFCNRRTDRKIWHSPSVWKIKENRYGHDRNWTS